MKKYVLVTGASSGIGKQIALKLAANDYFVFAGVRKKTDKNLLESLNKNILGVYLDVSNNNSVAKAFHFIYQKTQDLCAIVNNAGIAICGPIELLSIEELKKQFDVNTFGPLRIVQKFLPIINNGKIINISSMASSGIFPFISPYSASKKACEILFNALNLECKKSNVKIVTIRPGVVKTPIWDKAISYNEKILEKIDQQLLIKYEKELKVLKQNAKKNNIDGLEGFQIAELVFKIIKNDKVKSVYNIGLDSKCANFLSKLPQDFVNNIVRSKLRGNLSKVD